MKVIVSLSGGMDSSVLLYHFKSLGDECRAISIDYGQRHRKELAAAALIAERAGVEHKIINLSVLRDIMGGSSQTSDLPVPEGHYEEESMKQTVVPNRNMILLAVAGAWAVSTKSAGVAYAAHAGDHAIYPDCRPEFAKWIENALAICDWHPVSLFRPFLKHTKADIVSIGAKLGVPFELTWTCYKGLDKHCGKCGTCVERIEAFYKAKIQDPVEYETA